VKSTRWWFEATPPPPTLRGAAMSDESEEFRRRAADCLALARATSDPYTRLSLLTMAQRLHTMANGSAVEFDSILRNFNDEQLMRPRDGKPVMQQQQQQIQSKKDNETN
jgi:hypothetical protein